MKTMKLKSDGLLRRIALGIRFPALRAGLLAGLTSLAGAQTIIPGPTISTSTWTPSGNPYIVSGNCTISSGQTLTIQPGVIVEVGNGVTIQNNGLILAAGTPDQHVEFKAPVASQYWNTISNNYGGVTNLFSYCDFANAQTPLIFLSYQNDATMYVQIQNCTFSNCVAQGIYAASIGVLSCCSYADTAALTARIENCTFSGMSNGCVLYASGTSGGCPCGGNGTGYFTPTIVNNIFENLTGTACNFALGNPGVVASSLFANNTVAYSRKGVVVEDPWNITNEDNIFVGCTNAVMLTGSQSQQLSYNAFYGNATNLSGYNTNIYGEIIIANRNGTPCDLLDNIFTDPMFVSSGGFQLQTSSPCVSAGAPDEALANLCFPPSVGTNYDDMGAYGGPYACNWLTDVPLIAAQSLSITNTGTNVVLNWFDVPRSTYQVLYATNLPADSNHWFSLTNGQITAAGTPSTMTVVSVPPPKNSTRFYRVQSLGRAPGN